ncbi:DHH family phosphoesterase [Lachnobacterium bovis]|uniref:Phosphoesterase RecJ domain-containing protein n=1 Tax=Lachnobacterium bovis TaxID=140626 RepID=A0A1H9QLP3_9FIRM|nr:bifunctional oligoribonuclease/PAP phosphatase NrnA [Lachnobacterium bovis]SER60759.1 phosphoesterase RecJ domain-containing protein [Lachnobacterium bovis]
MNIDEILKGKKNIGIAGHVNPDGDCIGASLAFFNYVKETCKEIKTDVYLENIPNIFKFMNGSECIIDNISNEEDYNKEYDLFVVLDCGAIDRLGKFEKYYMNAKETLCIDHHITNNNYADYNYVVPEASSTCELLVDLLGINKISKRTAECLYTGIIHDTGVFQYTCTSKKTMNIAGELMQKGINYTKIIDDTYYTKTFEQNKVLGQALLNSNIHLNGKCVSSIITQKEMKKYNVLPKHLDGIINQLRVTKNIEVAIFLYEIEKDIFKASLRSNGKVDVSDIAVIFGGGGHEMAAGFSQKKDPELIIDNVIKEVSKRLL